MRTVVRHFMKTKAVESGLVKEPLRTLELTANEYLVSKLGTIRVNSYDNIEKVLLALVAEMPTALPEDVTPADLEIFLRRHASSSPSTWNTKRAHLNAFFTYCFNRQYIPHNPVLGVETKRFDRKPPKILTAEETDQAMRLATHGGCQLFMALSLFAGLRRSEIANIRKGDITEHGVFVSEKGKSRKRRIVEIRDRLRPYLQGDEIDKIPMPERPLRNIKKSLGIDMHERDVYRHTYGTMLYALTHDLGYVCSQMGNTPDVCRAHYLNVVPESEARAFWREEV